MTAYIERIVTEVVIQPEREQAQGQVQVDLRFIEEQKVAALTKLQYRKSQRTSAEGIDD